MKKIFEYFGLFCLICFSFIITEKTTTVVQEVDDIMIQIKNEMMYYNVRGMNAKIVDDYITPGLVSKTVNITKSYENMKEKGVYDSSFYIYDLNKPEISIDNNLDKYILNGNKEKNMVSLIFLVDSKNIIDIQKIVGNTPVSFILESYNIDKQINSIINANNILIAESNSDNYELISNKLKSIGVKDIHCFNKDKNKEFHEICRKDKKYTLTADDVIQNNPLTNVKRGLSAGKIFVFKINDEVIQELPNIISYIKSRGYVIESLSNHLSENW